MILSKVDCGNLSGNDSDFGELLHDIEEISNALYVERKPHHSSLVSSSSLGPNLGIEPCIYNLKSNSKAGFNGEGEMLRENHKPSSIWGWKPLKALSHIRQKKFACYFFCHVHSVENLSSNFDGICMSVHLKRNDNVLRTRPSRVSSGTVEFEETLMRKCTVYGAKNGPGNFMKYDPKHFLLCVSIIGFEGFDFGKHWVDLTRLLPLTLEELEKDKCSGKWSTSFKLEGKARGATLHVSFGFLVTKDTLAELGGNIRLPLVLNLKQNRLSRTSFVADCVSSKGNTSLTRAGSVPSSLTNASSNSQQCLDVKFGCPMDVSDFSNSIDKLYGKLEEKGMDNAVKLDLVCEHPKSLKVATESLTDSKKEFFGSRHDDEFLGKELRSNPTSEVETRLYDSTIGDLDVSMVEVIDVAEIFKGNGISSDEDAKPSVEEDHDSLENDLLVETDGILEREELTELELEQLMDKLSDELKVNYMDKEGLLEIQEYVEPVKDLMTGELKENCIDQESLIDIRKSPKLEPSDDLVSGEFEKEGLLDIQKSPKLEPSPSDDLLFDEFIKEGLFDIQKCQTLAPSFDLMPGEFKVNCIDMDGLLDDQKSPKVEPSDHLMTGEFKVKHKGNKFVKSLSLDDVSKAVVEDFCNMWEESDPSTPRSTIESPRERLLRQFEEDLMTSENLFLEDTILKEESEYGYELELEHAAPSVSSMGYTVDSIDLSPLITKDTSQNVNQASRSKSQAKTLEDLETRSLMERWGLDEDAFLDSQHYSNGGFGSPIFVPSELEEPVGLPPLGEGLDPLLQLKNGGLLRSMSPLLFKNAKNCGSLIMQASKLVVLPAELGSDFMEILQCMASVGSEILSKKVRSLLPLDVISGNIMQQLALEASYEAKTHSRRSSHSSAHHESEIKIQIKGTSHFPDYNSFCSSSSVSACTPSECVSTRDLSAMALDTMEALTIEGLKVQSDMSTENVPSTIRIKPVSEPSDLSYVDGLLDLSISLDEWLQLDSGIFADENDIGDQTLNLLRAHHSKIPAEKDLLQNEARKCGLLGDNLTLCLMIQLRDPLRNYEPVGIPMLGLIQMERLLSSPGSENEINGKIESKERVLTFIFKEVHLAGLNMESDRTESWASKRHQQSGSRWLISSGLTHKPDSHFSMSKSLIRSTTQVFRKRSKSFLWSISQPVERVDTGSQFSTWDLHSRNPDIIFP